MAHLGAKQGGEGRWTGKDSRRQAASRHTTPPGDLASPCFLPCTRTGICPAARTAVAPSLPYHESVKHDRCVDVALSSTNVHEVRHDRMPAHRRAHSGDVALWSWVGVVGVEVSAAGLAQRHPGQGGCRRSVLGVAATAPQPVNAQQAACPGQQQHAGVVF